MRKLKDYSKNNEHVDESGTRREKLLKEKCEATIKSITNMYDSTINDILRNVGRYQHYMETELARSESRAEAIVNITSRRNQEFQPQRNEREIGNRQENGQQNNRNLISTPRNTRVPQRINIIGRQNGGNQRRI